MQISTSYETLGQRFVLAQTAILRSIDFDDRTEGSLLFMAHVATPVAPLLLSTNDSRNRAAAQDCPSQNRQTSPLRFTAWLFASSAPVRINLDRTGSFINLQFGVLSAAARFYFVFSNGSRCCWGYVSSSW